jgi:hypothetical protein
VREVILRAVVDRADGGSGLCACGLHLSRFRLDLVGLILG